MTSGTDRSETCFQHVHHHRDDDEDPRTPLPSASLSCGDAKSESSGISPVMK